MRQRQAWTTAPETAGDALTALDPESNEQEDIVSYSDPIEDIVAATLRDGGGTWTRDLVPVGRPDAWAVGHALPVGYSAPAHALSIGFTSLAVDHLLGSGAAYVGTWLDRGIVYIDAVDLIVDRAEAIALGRRRGELAIYNLSTEETIDLTEEA